MNTETLNAWLKQANDAALIGGRILLDYQDKLEHIRSKSCDNDLVTEADVASETAILGLMQKAFPEHAFLAEESVQELNQQINARYVWAIDPLDGTVNYAHGLPFYCVSIGLLDRKQNLPVLGVIYAPALNEIYLTVQGGPVLLNGRPVSVSTADSLARSLLATGFPYQRAIIEDNNFKEFFHFARLAQDVRRPGAAALDLAYVACGRFEGFWENHLHPWDIVAGAALVLSAGGQVSAYDGSPLEALSGQIVASNGLIHKQLLTEMQTVRKS